LTVAIVKNSKKNKKIMVINGNIPLKVGGCIRGLI